MNATLLKLQNSHSILWKWRGFFWGKSSEKLLAKGSRSIIEQSRSGKSLVCFSILRMACFSALCTRIFGTPCKVYIEAIELSSCWLYWVLLAEWMMLKAFSRNGRREMQRKIALPPSFAFFFVATMLSTPTKKGLSALELSTLQSAHTLLFCFENLKPETFFSYSNFLFSDLNGSKHRSLGNSLKMFEFSRQNHCRWNKILIWIFAAK